MRARLQRTVLSLVVLAGGVLQTACRHDLPESFRQHHVNDLVVNGVATIDAHPAKGQQHTLIDETCFCLELRSGARLSAPVELEAAPRLVVSGCVGGLHDLGEAESAGSITLVIRTTRGRRRVSVSLDEGWRGWWSRQLDLGELAQSTGFLELRADLVPGARLYLRELSIEDEREVSLSRLRPPQVLLISVDTLRRDALGTFGGPWPTPRLDELARSCQVFTTYYASAAWTKPSHAGLLTGQLGGVHGCVERHEPLADGVPTLAQRFAAQGFRTQGLVAATLWMSHRYGFGRGFEQYQEVRWGARHMVGAASSWIAEHVNEPFFYFLHLYDVHSDAAVLPYEGDGVSRETIKARFGVSDYGCRDGVCATKMLVEIMHRRARPRKLDAAILPYLYGQGVTSLDAHLGRLLDDIVVLGVYDDLLIVLTSDHGEALLEHPHTVLHGTFWEEVIRAPLLVKWPHQRHAGERVTEPVSALDVAPTLVVEAGIAGDDLPGRALQRPLAPTPIFLGERYSAVVNEGYKAVVDRRFGTHLYDLAADPFERDDLSSSKPELLDRLRRLLEQQRQHDQALGEQWTSRHAEQPQPGISAEEQEQLGALGYVDE